MQRWPDLSKDNRQKNTLKFIREHAYEEGREYGVDRPPTGVRVVSEELVKVPREVRWMEPKETNILFGITELVEDDRKVTQPTF